MRGLALKALTQLREGERTSLTTFSLGIKKVDIKLPEKGNEERGWEWHARDTHRHGHQGGT